MEFMQHLFLSYNLALIAKEKGFHEKVLGYYSHDKILKLGRPYPDYIIEAPLYQQIIDWFREKHNIIINSIWESLGSDEWCYGWEIRYLPKEFEDAKRRCPHFKIKTSFSISGGACYIGGWDTPIEAINEAIEETFKLI